MLRIATWNVAFGRQLPVLLESVRALPSVDLISLQELSIHDGRDDAEAIASRLGVEWRSAQITAQTVSGRAQANGMVWNSARMEMQAVETIELPTPSGRVMRRLPPQRRTAVVAEMRLDGRPLRLYAVHLDVLGITHKHAQLARVFADASGRAATELSLIAGDMNTYGIAGRPRWTELRRQKLDAVFAAPRGLRHRAWRLPLPGSDHLPVLVDLELPADR
jgi:endonuclease/exonuclease/phosphatase family metal-dependent hydrolase